MNYSKHIDFFCSDNGLYEAEIVQDKNNGEYLVTFAYHEGIGAPSVRTGSLDYARDIAQKYCNTY